MVTAVDIAEAEDHISELRRAGPQIRRNLGCASAHPYGPAGVRQLRLASRQLENRGLHSDGQDADVVVVWSRSQGCCQV